ncbi:MAG: aldo/keto reductase, partial [Sediminibacterium sp.]
KCGYEPRQRAAHLRSMGGLSNLEEGLEAMFTMQQEGKILHVGISNVTAKDLEIALSMGSIATVENMYGHAQRATLLQYGMETHGGDELLELCEQNQIPLIPFFSLVHGIAKKDTRIAEIAQKYNASEAQVNIAWLLHKSPWLLPIPGTSSLVHFEENMKAAEIRLTEEDMQFLE